MNGRAITRPTACLPVRISRLLAALVELLERNRLLVRRDLEDGVRRRVDDPLAGLLVLLAELLDDLRPGRLVAEHAARGGVHERVDHVVREAVGIRRQGLRRDDAHHLPVAERRVFPLGALEAARHRGRTSIGATPSSGATLPSPSASIAGRSRPPTARATLPRVSDPSSPNSAASGRAPAPTPSSTMTHARGMCLSRTR